MPEGYTKLEILVEDPREVVTTSEIESFVKLKLRRNNLEYFSQEGELGSPTLYINLNIGSSRDDLYFGNISVEVWRSSLYHLTISDYYKSDFNIVQYTSLKGRSGIYGATVETYQTIFLKSPPASQNVKDILDKLLDQFISDYIDANNL